jgi:hypothetical protein
MPFDVKLRHNLEYEEREEGAPRFYFEVDLSKALPRPVSSCLPVYWRRNPEHHPLHKEFYSVELAGCRVERANLVSLQKALPKALEEMISFGTLPYYYFSWPGTSPVPAYHSEGKLRLKGMGITGDDAGEVWCRLAETLVGRRIIQNEGQLELGLLLWRDMRLRPLAFALQAPRTWIPIFYSRDAERPALIYDLIGYPSRFLEVGDVFSLRREVASSLLTNRKLSYSYDLGITELQDEIWSELISVTKPTGFVLTYSALDARLEMPVLEAQGDFFAAREQSRRRLYFGESPEEVRRRAAAELHKEGKLSSSSLLTLEAIKRR